MLKANYLILLLLFFSCSNIKENDSDSSSEVDFDWVNKPDEIYASEKLNFIVSGNFDRKKLKLGMSNDFGSTIITPVRRVKNNYAFVVPEGFTKVSGVLFYTLSYNNKIIDKGKMNVLALEQTSLLETYCGPPYMIASLTDYSMLVVIPNDIYDNPNSGSYTSAEFDDKVEVQEFIESEELLTYRKIFSREKKGKVLAKAFTDTVQSKVSDLTIIANNPVNFTIDYSRNTQYADGKELTTIKTSVIRDRYNNIIENGTLVSFYLSYNNVNLKAYGKVVNGIATAQFVHPDEEREYSVKAYVENSCSSNTIKIKYLKVTF
ncbi:hypothetical protein [Tenacibaculum xiamenense]|uniref:hypothetical protein n=1 Tax=Tenacibaculum xiamenense TaxID=1261553 RepID=UPI0038937F49